MDIQIRLERRATPRSSLHLQHPPLALAANPALLADLQAAVVVAEADPRAVNCFFQGALIGLGYARYLLQKAREEAPSKQGLECGCGCTASGCGNEQCFPEKPL